jgi:hypothetical protein
MGSYPPTHTSRVPMGSTHPWVIPGPSLISMVTSGSHKTVSTGFRSTCCREVPRTAPMSLQDTPRPWGTPSPTGCSCPHTPTSFLPSASTPPAPGVPGPLCYPSTRAAVSGISYGIPKSTRVPAGAPCTLSISIRPTSTRPKTRQAIFGRLRLTVRSRSLS